MIESRRARGDVVKKTRVLLEAERFNVSTRLWVLKYHSYEAVFARLVGTYNGLLAK
jgi:hypothetical protein